MLYIIYHYCVCVYACVPGSILQEEDAKEVGGQQCYLSIGGLWRLRAEQRFLLTNCEVHKNPRSDIWQAKWILFLTTSKISPSDTIKVKFNSS